MFTEADWKEYELKLRADGLKMAKVNSLDNQKEYSDPGSADVQAEELDLVGQNAKNFDLKKLETGKKFDLDKDSPTRIDFEKMSAAERRRLNFKKAGTKAYQPF